MSVRPAHFATLLVAAGLASATSLGAQGVEYAPGSASYHVSTATKGSQSSPMGNQAFEIGVEQRITVDFTRRTRDTLAATVTIDSIALHSDGPTPDVSKYQGLKFVSLISPTGHVYSTKAPEGSDPLLSQLAESVGQFLPSYHADLRLGSSWADTTSGKVMQQGMLVDRTSIVTYTVGGDTTVAGERAVKLTRHLAVTSSGSGSANGTEVSVAGTSASDGVVFLARRGGYLGGRSNDDVNLKLTLVAQKAEITIKQSATQTVTPVR